MKIVEKTGKTVEEAIEAALSEMKTSLDNVEVEVLEEASRGLFGILGGKEARIVVRKKREKAEIAKEFISCILTMMKINASIEMRTRPDSRTLEIIGKDLGLLIGRRGETLRSLEILMHVACTKGISDGRRLCLDIAGYRRRREKDLMDIAHSVAKQVAKTGRSIILDPMNARDRRVIHTTLQNEKNIITYSQGEEPVRRVIVAFDDGSENPK